ncbi:MAG: SEL1-like repeat protein [Clostridia bacterium]|nr:SEL1-like repeat protein [Clostridia bacterium]
MSEMIYDAFISYSHKDMRWARWIQERLESYRLPKDLLEESEVKKQNLKVFRDQTDLAGVELQASLQRELEACRTMIVICSPNSAASTWVNEEIRYFKSLGRADSIIPFIVDGEPESSNPEIECFPEELRNDADHHFMGANTQEIGKNNALLKVISVCLGVRFDRLANREQKRRRRNFLISGSILLLVVAVFVGLLWRNMVIAQENARVAKENEQMALEREQIALENERIAKENEQIALENERIAKENEQIAQENERIAKENEALAYDDYLAILLSSNWQTGNFSPEDIARIEASANAGNPYAYYLLGSIYSSAILSNRNDPELGFSWLLRGAEAGSVECMYALGICYQSGRGTEQDLEAAYSWFLRAAQAGDPHAMYNVGACLESGSGTKQNTFKALSWYRKAAEAGYTEAYMSVAYCYIFGSDSIEPNYSEALYWIKKLAEAGHPEGMYLLGIYYQNGIGTEENPREAYLWYRRSAEEGNTEAMYKTGWCLENHYGVTSEAEEWYQRAADLGQEDAIEALKRLQEAENQSP